LNGQISQDEINTILWRACDTFRGAVDPAEYKYYILVMLFVKYISDVWADHYETYRVQRRPAGRAAPLSGCAGLLRRHPRAADPVPRGRGRPGCAECRRAGD